jgi:hypothetical protein
MDRRSWKEIRHSVIEGMTIAAYAIGSREVTSTAGPSTRWRLSI